MDMPPDEIDRNADIFHCAPPLMVYPYEDNHSYICTRDNIDNLLILLWKEFWISGNGWKTKVNCSEEIASDCD